MFPSVFEWTSNGGKTTCVDRPQPSTEASSSIGYALGFQTPDCEEVFGPQKRIYPEDLLGSYLDDYRDGSQTFNISTLPLRFVFVLGDINNPFVNMEWKSL